MNIEKDEYICPDANRSYKMKLMPDWIKVKVQKPKLGIDHTYLFFNGKEEVTYGYAFDIEDDIVWISDFDRQTNEVATHWMPLPNPPSN